jgi:hypothetical protein
VPEDVHAAERFRLLNSFDPHDSEHWRSLSYRIPEVFQERGEEAERIERLLFDAPKDALKMDEFWWAFSVAAPFLVERKPEQLYDFFKRHVDANNPFYWRALHRAALVAVVKNHPAASKFVEHIRSLLPEASRDADRVSRVFRDVGIPVSEDLAFLLHPSVVLKAASNRKGKPEPVPQLAYPFYHRGEPVPLPVAVAAMLYQPMYPGANVQHEFVARQHVARSIYQYGKDVKLRTNPFYRRLMHLAADYVRTDIGSAAQAIQDAARRLHERGVIPWEKRDYFHNTIPSDPESARRYITQDEALARTGDPDAKILYDAALRLYGGLAGMRRSAKPSVDLDSLLKALVYTRGVDLEKARTAADALLASAHTYSPERLGRFLLHFSFAEGLLSPEEYDHFQHTLSHAPLPQVFPKLSEIIQQRIQRYSHHPYIALFGERAGFAAPKAPTDIAILHMLDVIEQKLKRV